MCLEVLCQILDSPLALEIPGKDHKPEKSEQEEGRPRDSRQAESPRAATALA